MRFRFGVINVVLAAVLVVTVGWASPAATAVPSTVEVDVLVIGGTPAGVAAAVAAARLGASVALVEPGPGLGGVLSSAWLTTFDMNIGPDGEHLTRGIFLEYYRRLGISFDRVKASKILGRVLVREPSLRVMVEALVVRVITEGPRVAASRSKTSAGTGWSPSGRRRSSTPPKTATSRRWRAPPS